MAKNRSAPDPEMPTPLGSAGPSSRTGLSAADLAWLAQEMTSQLAAHGVSVTMADDGTLGSPDGRVFGLPNVAQRLVAMPRDEWDAFVAQYCTTMSSIGPDRPATEAEFRRRLRPRVIAAAFFPEPMPAYAIDLGAGLYQVAALRYDDWTALLLADDDLDRLGGWAGAQKLAVANLRNHPVRYELLERKHELDAAVHCFRGQHKFVASRLIVLDKLMAGVGADTRGRPLLVGVPSSEELLVHLPVGPGALMVLDFFAEYCLRTFSTSPSALSPNVYFRDSQDVWHAIEVRPHSSNVVVMEYGVPVAEFLELMTRKARPWYGAAS